MHLRKIYSSILLGYLVLFLNLGPSLHRVSCFGLHEHQRHVVQESELNPTCCCCCQDESKSSSPQRNDSDTAIEKQLCDCLVCRFFKKYNASIESSEDLVWNARFELKHQICVPTDSIVMVANDARGPPVA